jgi:hypothetical protein
LPQTITVQVISGMTGDAMKLPTGTNKHECLSVRANTLRHLSMPNQQFPENEFPENRRDISWICTMSFVEDFTLEHSSRGLLFTSTEIAGAV